MDVSVGKLGTTNIPLNRAPSPISIPQSTQQHSLPHSQAHVPTLPNRLPTSSVAAAMDRPRPRPRTFSPRLRAIAITIFLLQVSNIIYIGNCQTPAFISDTFSGKRYGEGYCSMYDICGQRSDGKVLNCPNVTQAVKPDKLLSSKIQSLCPTITGNICCTANQFDTLRAQVQQAIPFLVGCPACLRNFLNLFCELSCSPNQSLFINVTSVTKVNNSSAVNGIDFYLSKSFSEGLYDSCKDVKFGTMNSRAMDFIGAGAHNYEEWLAFIGRQAGIGEFGSPYSISFRSNISQPSGMRPMGISAYSCGDSLLGCSCGDCPASLLCSGAPTPSAHQKRSCTIKIGNLKAKCIDFSMVILYIISMVTFTGMLLLFQRRRRNVSSSRRKSSLHVKVDNAISTKMEGNPDESFQMHKSENQAVKSLQASFIQRHITSFFREYGKWVVRHQTLVLCSSLLIPILLCIGLVRFNVETRPEKLWVGPGSRAAKEKQFFDSNLAPFYRIEQLIIATSHFESGKPPKIVTDNNLQLLFDIHKKVDGLRANYSGVSVSLADICLKPLGNACATQSVLQYFKMDPAKYGEYGGVDHIDYCLQHYSSAETCLSAFKAPLDPSTALGGFSGTNYSEASAFVITYPVNNALDLTGNENGKAVAWEKAFIHMVEAEIVPMVESHNLTISFSSESSVQEELKRESNADAITVLISYLVMFLYIAFTLGDVSNFSSLVVSSKVLLGLSGVVVVLLSVIGSIGFFSAIGVKSTLIIMEVIPFLVLAVGVDNMCILVHAVKRQPSNLPMESRLSNALAEVGPSITLASVSEVLAFAVGSFIPMPACRVFSMFAALAVFLDFLLQVSAFVVLITFDFSRAEDNRVDCFPCIKLPTSNRHFDKDIGQRNPGLLVRYMKEIHGPILSLRGVKIAVVAVFVAFTFASIALSIRIQAGLEQKIVLPRDSYLQGYFNDLSEYLRVGPPLYLVVKDFNYSSSSTQTNQLCSISQCDSDSLLNEISRASLAPELSYIAKPAASWLDDFLVWLSPEAFGCCRKFTNGSYCPPDDQPPCCPADQASCGLGAICKDCTTCFLHSDMLNGRPSTLQFREKLPWFLDALPSSDCAKGGRGAYSTNVDLNGYESGIIHASAFRTYHTPLNKQIDYVNALRAAREFSARVSNSLKIEIYPYSVFYIFFEQYLDIWRTALINMSIGLGAVFVVCLVITGSLWSSAIILLVLAMIVVDIMGVMAILGIQLNAVSVVNLVMSIGIAVEFCVHIMHAFSVSSGDRDHRAKEALSTMGASVFSGITLTKLVGVIVLRFAKSEIFVVYYFQMYLALVLIGFLHGLVFLPVLLSICGPPSRAVVVSRQENPSTVPNQEERVVTVNGGQELDR